MDPLVCTDAILVNS